MAALDWTIVIIYMIFMIGLSVFLGRGQTNQEDYYLGGRNLPWWGVAISTMATQTSAVILCRSPPLSRSSRVGG